MAEYELKLDEPWTFLNDRKNPVEGRRLTFALKDGTILMVDVSQADYKNPDAIKAKLQEQIQAHEALKALK